jgi:hypothetical protein
MVQAVVARAIQDKLLSSGTAVVEGAAVAAVAAAAIGEETVAMVLAIQPLVIRRIDVKWYPLLAFFPSSSYLAFSSFYQT